ncbi:MAG: hypothetical protein J2P26_02040 [Nocardiopsaceae bacterium]|nr:hypothetical protein [Nocardiopsaceae bacterium]
MDERAIIEHAHRVRIAGWVTNPDRWRFPETSLNRAEQLRARELYPTRVAAQDWLIGQLDASLQVVQAATSSGQYTDAFVCVDGYIAVFGFRKLYPQARQMLHLGIEAAHLAERPDWEGALCQRMGMSYGSERHTGAAMKWYSRALELHEYAGHMVGWASAAECLSRAHLDLDNPDFGEARWLATKAMEIFKRNNMARGVRIARGRLAAVQAREGRLDEAELTYSAVISDFDQAGDAIMVAKVRKELAGVLVKLGRQPEAHAELDAAQPVLLREGAVFDIAASHEVRARAYISIDDEAAREETAIAYQKYMEIGDRAAAERVRREMAADLLLPGLLPSTAESPAAGQEGR